LTTQEIEGILSQLKEIGIKIIGFTGGECLLRDDIGELIEKAKKILGAIVYIDTNGILLEKKAEILLEKDVDFINISLDGIGKTDERIRGVPGHYEMVIKGIKLLKKLAKEKGRKIEINVGTTLVKSNLFEVPQLIELCKELGVTWSFNLLDTSLYFFKNIDTSNLIIEDEDSVDRIIDYLSHLSQINKKDTVVNFDHLSLEFARNYLKNKKPYFNCVMGYLRIFINPSLDVYSGCWALPPVGNLKEKRLKEILKSKGYRERVKKMFDLNCPYCTCGYTISLKINHLPSTIIDATKSIWKYKKYSKFLKQFH
jgi:MoaA/NifB/PqqE/SkfB family radical SAM enzyme